MVMLSLTALDALTNHKNQPESYWKNSADRIKTGIFIPIHKPKFTISNTDKIFTIGSCFARRIEIAFEKNSITCTNLKYFKEKAKDLYNKNLSVNYLNKYSTHSILNEFKWAVNRESLPYDIIFELNNGKNFDLQASPHLGKESLDFLNFQQNYERHKVLITDSISKAIESDVIIITLGLVECWFDNSAKIYTNAGLLQEMIYENNNRFSFHVSNFNENLQNLEELYEIIHKNCKKNVKIIITTSPVPMAATFSGRDTSIANSYSKSVLRAVAEEWSNLHSNIDYFPSYEIAILSDKYFSYENDLIHINDKCAEVIVNFFLNNYTNNNVKLPLNTRGFKKWF
jgi:hypothetical protein